MKTAIQLAGLVQLIIASANFFAPAILDYRGNLARVSPMIRQIFTVHCLYIVLVLAGLAGACLFFANELTAHTPAARYANVFLAFFWGLRVCIQLFYYDRQTKREHVLANLFFTAAFLYLGVVFTLAAFL